MGEYEEEEDEVEIKSEIFDGWYEEVFGQDNAYQVEIDDLYKDKRISNNLHNLLKECIFRKNPSERKSISEILQHEWFVDDNDDEKEFDPNIIINQQEMDFFDALMSDDENVKQQIILYQKNALGINDERKHEDE